MILALAFNKFVLAIKTDSHVKTVQQAMNLILLQKPVQVYQFLFIRVVLDLDLITVIDRI